MKKERDVILFRNILRFYSFLGIFPYVQRWMKLILLSAFLSGVMISYKLSSYYLPLWVISSLTYVLGLGNLMLTMLFNFLCLKNTFGHEPLWDVFLHDIETFDFTMKIENDTLEENIYKYYSVFVLSNISYIVIYILYLPYALRITINFLNLTGLIYSAIIYIEIAVVVLCLREIYIIIERRYEYFKLKTKATYLNPKNSQNFWNGQQLSAAYLLLVNMIKNVNKIFGTKVLIILFKAAIDVNGCLSVLLMESRQANFGQLANASCAQMLISLVSIFPIYR